MADASSCRRVRAQGTTARAGPAAVADLVPDVTAKEFAAEAYRQSRAVAASGAADDDQTFVESVSDAL